MNLMDRLRERAAKKLEALTSPEPNTGCWLWFGRADAKGYGRLRYSGTNSAHRVSWILHNGPIPRGLLVCHRCDVPACVNPAHLFLGTAADNNRDRDAKGRGASGARCFAFKLSEEAVAIIRARKRQGSGTMELAREFGVCDSHIRRIVRGARRTIGGAQ